MKRCERCGGRGWFYDGYQLRAMRKAVGLTLEVVMGIASLRGVGSYSVSFLSRVERGMKSCPAELGRVYESLKEWRGGNHES